MTPEQVMQWKRDRDAELLRAFPGDPEIRHFLISYKHADPEHQPFRDELDEGLHNWTHEDGPRQPPTEAELDERGVPLNATVKY